jgi:hypothetical protein
MGEEPDGIASHVVTRQRLQGYIHDEWGVACSLQRVTALCKEWGLVMGEYNRCRGAHGSCSGLAGGGGAARAAK